MRGDAPGVASLAAPKALARSRRPYPWWRSYLGCVGASAKCHKPTSVGCAEADDRMRRPLISGGRHGTAVDHIFRASDGARARRDEKDDEVRYFPRLRWPPKRDPAK